MKPQAAFEYLNRIAGIAPLGMPVFQGQEAVVPSPFRVATAAAASLGLAAAGAAEIWRFRGGDRQSVEIDLAAAAATLVSWKFTRRNGEPIALPESPVTGFYQCADGRWIHLHGGLPRLERRTLDLLNAAPDAIVDGVAKWQSLALEDALAFMQLAGAVVRGAQEWKTTVASRVLGPPLSLKRIGQAPPLRLGAGRMPLEGLHVLDLTQVIAGPACGRLIAAHGAEVLALRAEHRPRLEAFDCDLGAGKRLCHLDLEKPADAEILRRLVRDADVFVDSHRPGALTGLGFSPAALAHIAPGMIYVSISGYGLSGPWCGRRGFEELAQSATGLAVEQGAFMAQRRKSRREALPELIPAQVCDYVTGYLAAAGVMAALLNRIRQGGSWLVEVSLAATAAWLDSMERLETVPETWEPRDGLDPYLGSCETKDGRFELLGPVVRMSKTPPLVAAPPDHAEAPRWVTAHEGANAAEVQSA